MGSARFLLPLVAVIALAPAVAGAADNARLVDAAKAGDAAAVRALVRGHADVNLASADGTTALHWAAERGDIDLAKVLIRAGANVRAANRYGITPLRLACEQGAAAVVEALLAAGADVNERRAESGDTLLMVAARSGHADIVRTLVAHHAELDAVEPARGQTALMWAAAERHADVVKALLDAGAKADIISTTGLSALMFAIREGDLAVTKVLIDRPGMDVNARAKDGTSMLILAILNAHLDVAKLLLERGADPSVNDPHGLPLHVLTFLRRAQNTTVSSYLPRQLPDSGVDSFMLAHELLARGADINARYMQFGAPKHMAAGSFRIPFIGATAFFIAATQMDLPFMRFLVANGADPTTPSGANVTPLIAASGLATLFGATPGTPEEAFAAVKLCADLGNDPLATVAPSSSVRIDPTYVDATALFGAGVMGANDLVRWLVEKGVRLDHKSKRGSNAYQVTAAIDGRIYNPQPETADLMLKLAKERGIVFDTNPLPNMSMRELAGQ
jgi:ankyrin repeat protein